MLLPDLSKGMIDSDGYINMKNQYRLIILFFGIAVAVMLFLTTGL